MRLFPLATVCDQVKLVARVTLAQLAIESKQNEISAAPTLLGYVDLRNKVVVGDAMHTQRQISIQIGKAGGNYIWTVKGNQPQ
jgi:predicted transposase YbfD/YdcC